MADAISNFVTEVIKLLVIAGFLYLVLVIGAFLLGFHIEVTGMFRCRQRHPTRGTRCALKSGGHWGVAHRDRLGRSWW